MQERTRSARAIKLLLAAGVAAIPAVWAAGAWRTESEAVRARLQQRLMNQHTLALAMTEKVDEDPTFDPAFRQFVRFLNLAESFQVLRGVHTDLTVPENTEELLHHAAFVARSRARSKAEVQRVRQLEARLRTLDQTADLG